MPGAGDAAGVGGLRGAPLPFGGVGVRTRGFRFLAILCCH